MEGSLICASRLFTAGVQPNHDTDLHILQSELENLSSSAQQLSLLNRQAIDSGCGPLHGPISGYPSQGDACTHAVLECVCLDYVIPALAGRAELSNLKTCLL